MSNSARPEKPCDDPIGSSVSPKALPKLTESMDLVQRYQGGEESALDLLLRRYQDRLRRIVSIRLGSRLRDHLESMDIVQNANMVAARKLSDLEVRDQGSILKWLSQIALNQIRDADDRYLKAIKRGANEKLVHLDSGNSQTNPAGMKRFLHADDPLPEEIAYRAEIREILDESMKKLPEDFREIILLRDYYGGSWEFVGAEMARGANAARELHRRAWIRLRRIVRPRLGELA